jgi:hypothetical protein
MIKPHQMFTIALPNYSRPVQSANALSLPAGCAVPGSR